MKMMAVAPHRWFVQPLVASYITFGVGYCFIHSKGNAKTRVWDKADIVPTPYFFIRFHRGIRGYNNKIMKTFRMIGMALMAVLMCVNFTSCSEDDDDFSSGGEINIPKNTIRYQTTDGSRIRFKNEDVFGGTKIVKHTYSADDWWVMEFESDVTAIEYRAFYENETLLSIILPNSVKTIGESAFDDCSGLTSITIPNSVTSIGNYAFCDCSGLTSIEIPNSVTSIGNYAFRLCEGLTSIEIPSSVTSIGNDAFYGCGGLTSVTIGNSVTIIGDYAFEDCRGLTSITIPNSVTIIGGSAFKDCSGLTSVTIGSGVTSIGYDAFGECFSLTNIYVKASTPAKIEWRLGCENATLYVPKGSLEAYKAADGWKEFENIQEWDAK